MNRMPSSQAKQMRFACNKAKSYIVQISFTFLHSYFGPLQNTRALISVNLLWGKGEVWYCKDDDNDAINNGTAW